MLVDVFTNHILVENTYFINHIGWTEHKIMVLKPAIKYQIVQHCNNFKRNSYQWFPSSFISLMSKSFVRFIFYGGANGELKRWDN